MKYRNDISRGSARCLVGGPGLVCHLLGSDLLLVERLDRHLVPSPPMHPQVHLAVSPLSDALRAGV